MPGSCGKIESHNHLSQVDWSVQPDWWNPSNHSAGIGGSGHTSVLSLSPVIPSVQQIRQIGFPIRSLVYSRFLETLKFWAGNQFA